MNTTKYIDDLLATLYGMDRFYNCETYQDLVGHLIMGIAPHTRVRFCPVSSALLTSKDTMDTLTSMRQKKEL